MLRIADEFGILPDLIMSFENGWRNASFDPGFPSVDEDTQSRVQANGVIDYTRFYNESIVTYEGIVVPPVGVTRQQLVDRLAQYCHPARRVRIHWQHIDDTTPRSIACRGRNLIRPNNAWNRRSVQAQWVAASGVQESSVQAVVRLVPSLVSALPGRTYPLVFNRVYPLASPAGATLVQNDGNEVAWPIIRINGPATNPTITNTTTGEIYSFTIVIPDGNFLEIRTGEDLILMNSNINDSRYGSLDLTTTKWWGIQPGSNALVFAATGTSTNTYADIYYRHAYI